MKERLTTFFLLAFMVLGVSLIIDGVRGKNLIEGIDGLILFFVAYGFFANKTSN